VDGKGKIKKQNEKFFFIKGHSAFYKKKVFSEKKKFSIAYRD